MTTCRELITAAYRKARVRGRGDTLDAEEAADGLFALQSFYDEMVGEGVFGRLTDVVITAAYEADEQERVFNTDLDGGGEPWTVTLPVEIEDGFATDGARPPRDLALVVIAGDPVQNYVYSSQLGAWVSLTGVAGAGLTLEQDAPLAERGADALACLFAAFIAEENGKTIGPVTAARAMAFRSRLTHRPSAEHVPTQAEYF